MNFGPRRPLAPVVLAALVVAYCLFCYLPVLHADWFVIDDHSVIDQMGTADHLSLSRAFDALQTTEINPNATTTRYRLLYFPFLFLESVVYGKHVAFWYAERIAFACLLGLALFAAARLCFGLLIGFAFTIFELTDPYWGPGMFTRLGSGESYGVLGLASIVIAFCIDGRRMSSLASAVLLSLGLIVCVGTKENFLPFVLLPVAVLIYARRELSLASKLWLWGSIVFASWSAAVIVYRIKQASHDIYMRDATVSGRSHLLFDFFRLPSVRFWLIAMLIGLICWLWRRRASTSQLPTARSLGPALVVNVVALGFYFSQFVFYNGDWPDIYTPRYLFPGLLVRDFAVMVLLVALIAALPLDSLPTRRWLARWPRIDLGRHAVEAALVAALVILAAPRFFENRHRAVAMAKDSTHFTQIIRDVVADMKRDPGAALVIDAHAVGDYEPIISISQFVRAFGGQGPIMLELDEASARKTFLFGGKGDQLLVDDLRKIEKEGSGYIQPFSKDRLANCISIGLSGSKSPSCAKGVDYNVPWEG